MTEREQELTEELIALHQEVDEKEGALEDVYSDLSVESERTDTLEHVLQKVTGGLEGLAEEMVDEHERELVLDLLRFIREES